MHDIVLQLLNGLVVGSSLALVASGLALVFGVLDIVNFAQGELFMLGGYVLFFTLQATGNFGLGLLAAVVLVGLLGGAVLYGMVWPLLGRSQALPLLATVGLSLIIQQAATNTFNSTTRSVQAPITLRIPVENLDYPAYNLAIVLVSAAILAAGYLFLKYTKYGIWLRAVAENRPMAGSLGVPVPRVRGQRLAADGIQGRGHPRRLPPRRDDRPAPHLIQRGVRGRAADRRPAGEQGVQGRPQAEHVTRRPDLGPVAPGLLRAHEPLGPHDVARLR